MTKLLIILSTFAACLNWVYLAFAQQTTNTNTTHSPKPAYRPGCAPTAAYKGEMVRIMTIEANRFARQMNLPEDVPIARTNTSRAFVMPPSWCIQCDDIGYVDTARFSYHVDPKKGVVSVDSLFNWEKIRANYIWPVSRLDTNLAFQEALTILKKADIDVDNLNRDATSVSIRASTLDGPRGNYFVPIYWIIWRNPIANDPSDDRDEPRILLLAFLEPTKAVLQLNIFRHKYIKRAALESPDLLSLLTTDPVHNPPEATLREIESRTNATIRRQIFGENYVPESRLQKSGLRETTAPAEADAATAADSCIHNLIVISAAKHQWANDNKKDPKAIPTWDDLTPYLAGPWGSLGFKPPKCPSGGSYTIGQVCDLPTCSFPKHNLASTRVLVHVSDGSIDKAHSESDRGLGEERTELRRAGCIAGATTLVLDESGNHTTAVTDGQGWAVVNTWPHKAISVIVSKRGFLTISNTITLDELVQTGVDVRLQRQAK